MAARTEIATLNRRGYNRAAPFRVRGLLGFLPPSLESTRGRPSGRFRFRAESRRLAREARADRPRRARRRAGICRGAEARSDRQIRRPDPSSWVTTIDGVAMLVGQAAECGEAARPARRCPDASVGSSSSRTSGCCARARASTTRCFSPPEISCIQRSAQMLGADLCQGVFGDGEIFVAFQTKASGRAGWRPCKT